MGRLLAAVPVTQARMPRSRVSRRLPHAATTSRRMRSGSRRAVGNALSHAPALNGLRDGRRDETSPARVADGYPAPEADGNYACRRDDRSRYGSLQISPVSRNALGASRVVAGTERVGISRSSATSGMVLGRLTAGLPPTDARGRWSARPELRASVRRRSHRPSDR